MANNAFTKVFKQRIKHLIHQDYLIKVCLINNSVQCMSACDDTYIHIVGE